MAYNTHPPEFDIQSFVMASLDFLNAHPMVFSAFIGAAAVCLWKLGVLIGIEWEIRSVRAARDREVAEIRKREADKHRKLELIAAIIIGNPKGKQQ